MPESKVRKSAADKRKVANRRKQAMQRSEKRRLGRLGADRSWVPWVFIPVAIAGVAWLVVFYIAGYRVPLMRDLGDWNILIGMGLFAASFAIATLWK